jgi:glycosyltransferase involved in cell wall biosynthesis
MNWCVVIPTYNNDKTLERVLCDVLLITGNVIVVNDGSTDQTHDILDRFPAVTRITYPVNKGKGYALRKGFEKAIEMEFDYAVTIDSDGQHYYSDIPLIVKKAEEVPGALIIGTRTLPGEKLRKGSGFANKFSNFWFRIISGVSLPDTQSGFRMYPLKAIEGLKFFSKRYEFELEVLYRAAWRNVRLINIPVKVFYPEKNDRISHFRPFRDFLRISILNTVCFFAAFLYFKPFSFLKYLKKENIRDFLKKNVLQTGESIQKLTFSVMFGIFMGIVPIWGYQLITAIALAYLFKLNKLIVIVAANISIPPMIPFILYLSYLTGGIILSEDNQLVFSTDISFAWVRDNLFQYIVGAVVFAVIAALFSGLVTVIFLKVVRKKPALLN